MKVIAVLGDEPLQQALAAKIHAAVPLAHVARIQMQAKHRRRKVGQSLVSVTIGRGLRHAWTSIQSHYQQRFPAWPLVETSIHDSANDEALVALVEKERPDLVVISGTDLLKRATIEAFGKVMNLHTGISPYIRGGPNCTNWALALGEFDLIGNTIMWIDPGIDTGAIIATERTPLTGRESLAELHLKVMEHAHYLYVRVVRAFARGKELRAVPQSSIAKGRLYLTRDWNGRAIARAVLNHRFRYRPFRLRPEIKLVPLD